ncbi:thiamine diphosphokinase [Blattabacterium cuenoti]|uniref:thiamine diphosphokinase n=1 Tax=Blattabacterium cuenoti TaxID=1653831 RepID=UPI00163D2657|nr:thiamine diphosphokinase [Blattabacterium cuenoti]
MNYRLKNKQQKIELFLNGDPPYFLKNKIFYHKIFSVDGAFYYLKKLGISIDYISGDFDSILKKDFPSKGRIFTTYNQKYTDFDKALNILYKKGFFNINVWGASGKEQDHFLGNLSTALKYKKKLSIVFHDKYYFYFFSKKKNIFFFSEKNKKISLFPFPEVNGLKTNGLKYPIHKGILKIGKNIGIRNESTNKKIEINYKKGELIIFIGK